MVEHISYHVTEPFLRTLYAKFSYKYTPAIMEFGDMYYSVEDGNEIIVRVKASQEEIRRFHSLHDYTVKRIVIWERDSKSQLVTMSCRELKVLDINGKLLRTLGGHKAYITCICLSDHSAFEDVMVVSGGSDGKILAHGLKSGKLNYTMSGHSGPVSAVTFCEGKGGAVLIASVDRNQRLILWSAADGTMLREFS